LNYLINNKILKIEKKNNFIINGVEFDVVGIVNALMANTYCAINPDHALLLQKYNFILIIDDRTNTVVSKSSNFHLLIEILNELHSE
jgi:hypothetical protein